MIWKFEERKHEIFSRNPLAAVIVDLRFNPILKVSKGLSDFQDLVRTRFPSFQKQSAQTVHIQSIGGAVEVHEDEIFMFQRDAGTKLSLTTRALTLEVRGHEHRDELISDFMTGAKALKDVFAPIQSLRLGLRYVNVLDKEKIEADLERSVSWSELIQEPFSQEPSGRAGEEGTFFHSEITSPAQEKGKLTLRYGLLPGPGTGRPTYRFDSDRFAEGDIALDEVERLLRRFSDDIFYAFRGFAGGSLIEWMEGKEA